MSRTRNPKPSGKQVVPEGDGGVEGERLEVPRQMCFRKSKTRRSVDFEL